MLLSGVVVKRSWKGILRHEILLVEGPTSPVLIDFSYCFIKKSADTTRLSSVLIYAGVIHPIYSIIDEWVVIVARRAASKLR